MTDNPWVIVGVFAVTLLIGALLGRLLRWRATPVPADAVNTLDCGCPRGPKVYTCLSYNDERCYVHQNALCCDERVSDHEHDAELAEVDATFAGDWELWSREMKERAE